MKKNIFFSFFLVFLSMTLNAQNGIKYETSDSKTEFIVIPKVGFATISQFQQPKLSGFVNGGDVLAAFKLINGSSVSFGLGYNEFSANTNLNGENASLSNTYLRIPVNYTTNFSFFKNKTNSDFVYLSAAIGFYANTLLKSKLEAFAANSSEKNLGWNFGFSTYIGAKFNVSDNFNLGLGMETNNDLSKMKKNNFEQKINNLTTVNLTLGFRLK